MKCIARYSFCKIFDYAIRHGMHSHDIFERLPVVSSIILGKEGWHDVKDWVALACLVSKGTSTTVENLGYAVSKHSRYDGIALSFVKVLPLYALTKLLLPHVKDSVNRNVSISLRNYSAKKKRVTIEVTPDTKEAHTQEICDYNRGTSRALMEVKGYKNVSLRETQCCFKGASSCIYELSWTGRKKISFMKYAKKLGLSAFREDVVRSAVATKGVSLSAKDIDSLFQEDDN